MRRRIEYRNGNLRELSEREPPSIVGVVPERPDILQEEYEGFIIRARMLSRVSGTPVYCIRPMEATRLEHILPTLKLLDGIGCAHDKAHAEDDYPCIQLGPVYNLEQAKQVIDSLYEKCQVF